MSKLLTVSNSSPLIGLEQIKQLELLLKLFGNVIVPEAVAKEVAPTVTLPNWITIQPLNQSIAARILETSLGPGESEAISLALELGNCQIILDDRAARRLAQGLGITVIGTLGILLAGKRKGFISEVRPTLDALMSFSFHIAPDLYKRVLSDAGE